MVVVESWIKRKSGCLERASESRLGERIVALNTLKERGLVAGGAGGLLLTVFASGRVLPDAIRVCVIIVSLHGHSNLAPTTYLHEPLAPQYTPSYSSFAHSRP